MNRFAPDDILKSRLAANRQTFEAIVATMSSFPSLAYLSEAELMFDGRDVSLRSPSQMSSLPEELRVELPSLRAQLKRLGVSDILQHEGIIELRVDNAAIWNGDTYKGYQFRPKGDAPIGLETDRLDKRPLSTFPARTLVYVRLEPRWFIYLFRN